MLRLGRNPKPLDQQQIPMGFVFTNHLVWHDLMADIACEPGYMSLGWTCVGPSFNAVIIEYTMIFYLFQFVIFQTRI